MFPNYMSISPNGETVILTDKTGSVFLINGTGGGFKYGYAKPGFKFQHTAFLSDSTWVLVSGFIDGGSKYPRWAVLDALSNSYVTPLIRFGFTVPAGNNFESEFGELISQNEIISSFSGQQIFFPIEFIVRFTPLTLSWN